MNIYPERNSCLGDPQTFEEALTSIESNVPDDVKTLIREGKFAQLHFTLGMYVRNNLGLWDKTSPLSTYFRSIGIGHADDMSSIIFESLGRKMRNEPLDVPTQVKYYRDYWRENNQDPDEFLK